MVLFGLKWTIKVTVSERDRFASELTVNGGPLQEEFMGVNDGQGLCAELCE